MKLLSLPPSSASAERNWSTQDLIISKRRNCLAPARAEKLVYIYFNLRSLRQVDAQKPSPGVTAEALQRWHSTLVVHSAFRWPEEQDGSRMFQWDEDADSSDEDSEFEGMHGDEMAADSSDEEEEKEPSDRALIPFEPDDHSTPGEGLRILPCPSRLPHDLQVGGKLARWFTYPYNAWHVACRHNS